MRAPRSNDVRAEALLFFRLTRNGESPEKLRETIAPVAGTDERMTLYRLAVLELFNEYVAAGTVSDRRERATPQKRKTTNRRTNNPHGNNPLGRPKEFSDTQRAQAMRALESGECRRDVAKLLGVSVMTLWRHVPYRKNRRPGEAAPQKQKGAPGDGWRKAFGQFRQGQSI